MGRRKSLTFCSLAVLLGLAVAVVVGEVVLRSMAPPPDTKARALPGSGRQYEYPKHETGYAGGKLFRTNSFGFRGREPDSSLSPVVLRIIVVGDSYAFGYGVEFCDSFPAQLEKMLSDSGTPARVFVLALPGYNTAQELAALQEFAPDLAPDLVLLSYHLNDIQRHAARGGDSSHSRSSSFNVREHSALARFLLPQLASIARAVHLPIKTTVNAEVDEYVHDGAAWQSNQRTLRDLIAFVRGDLSANLGVVVVPYFTALDEAHPAKPAYDVAERFFRGEGVPVTGVFDAVKGMRDQDFWINRFDGHPNELGHTFIARAAAALIRDNHLLPSQVSSWNAASTNN